MMAVDFMSNVECCNGLVVLSEIGYPETRSLYL